MHHSRLAVKTDTQRESRFASVCAIHIFLLVSRFAMWMTPSDFYSENIPRYHVRRRVFGRKIDERSEGNAFISSNLSSAYFSQIANRDSRRRRTVSRFASKSALKKRRTRAASVVIKDN